MFKKKHHALISSLFVSFILIHFVRGIWAGAGSIEQKLAAFYENTYQAMTEKLVKKDITGQKIVRIESIFNDESIASGQYLEAKNLTRAKILEKVSILGEPSYNDLVENFVDNKTNIIRDLRKMQELNLMNATLAQVPWSDDYWPIFKGILGNRFADSLFPNSMDWLENNKYILSNPADSIVRSGIRTKIAVLSPSEKYDLWIGNEGVNSLTNKMWEVGEEYYKKYGKVEAWMGICHGWAPASFMMDRPMKRVDVVAADGKTIIPMYPADLKSFASLLWAESGSRTRFVGGRCNDKNPTRDENGRVISETCFNTNPGTWHMSIVNQIGVSKRSFVMDANYDYEVWNQPVYGYQYSYFNPQELQSSDIIDSAIIPIEQFTIDKFKKYRSPKSKYVVGINMTVTYVVEKSPVQMDNESALFENLRTVNYRYDLELDAQQNIIGGEWYTIYHPDFLWVPELNSEASTVGDIDLDFDPNSDLKKELPVNVRSAAIRSAQSGSPLYKLVDLAVKASRTQPSENH